MFTDKIAILIYLICAGIIFAACYFYYTKKFLGDFLRKLADEGHNSSETAVTVEQLGYTSVKAKLINMALGEKSSLRRFAKTVYTEEEYEIMRTKGENQLYFLPDDVKETALDRYNCGKMKMWKLVVSIIALVLTAVICALVFPYIITMASSTGDNFSINDNVVGTKYETTVVDEKNVEVEEIGDRK